MRVDLVVYDGVDEMDVLGPLEVLRDAARAGGVEAARLVTREPQVAARIAARMEYTPFRPTRSPGPRS